MGLPCHSLKDLKERGYSSLEVVVCFFAIELFCRLLCIDFFFFFYCCFKFKIMHFIDACCSAKCPKASLEECDKIEII